MRLRPVCWCVFPSFVQIAGLSRCRNKKTKKKRKRRPTVVGRVVTDDARFRSVTESSLNTLRNAEVTLATAVSEKNTNLTQVVNDSVKNAIGVVADNIKDTVEKDVTTTVQKEVELKMAVVTSNITKTCYLNSIKVNTIEYDILHNSTLY